MKKILSVSYGSFLILIGQQCLANPNITMESVHSKSPLQLAAAPSTTPASEENPVQAAPKTSESQTPATPPSESAPATTIDCNYKIPAETTQIDQSLILKWAENATIQSFDYDFQKMDEKIASLKACYTDAGWKSFTEAFQKSGNAEAIKEQNLSVSSIVNGQLTISPLKENQWKVTVPLQVVYQNEKEKLMQPLLVELIISRKISGDLGIMQIIASPRNTTGPAPVTP